MKPTKLTWCFVSLVGLSYAQVINITGKVTDKNGTPLSGAIVTVVGKNIAATTDASGQYSIQQTLSAQGRLARPEMAYSVSKGNLNLNLATPSHVRVEAFDMRGSLVKVLVNDHLTPGMHQFPLSRGREATSVRVLRIKQDGKTVVWRSLSTLGVNSKVGVGEFSTRNSASAQASGVLDSMRASRAGFHSKHQSILSYSTIVDFILDSLVKTGTGSSAIDDGSQDRIAQFGKDQFFWGTLSGGKEVPLVKITHAITSEALDVVVTFNPQFVDLTYGTGAVGWSPRRGHTFRDLEISDHVEVAVMNCNGDTVFHGRLDLISASSKAPSGYAALGPFGGDGTLYKGDPAHVISFGTSMDDNLNYYGYKLLTNSPLTDSNYTPNPEYPYWQYYASYRLTLNPAAFGPSGYCGVRMTSVHASPAKDESETITVTEKPGPTPGSAEDPFRFQITPPPPGTTPVIPPDPDDIVG